MDMKGYTHKLLSDFCACYGEAYPAKTCEAESARLIDWMEKNPPPLGPDHVKVEANADLIKRLKAVVPYRGKQAVAFLCQEAAYALERTQVHPTVSAGDEQIEHLVARFLAWKLPFDFSPDGGVSFKPEYNEGTPHEGQYEPSGTNLLNYDQAREMVLHMIEGLPVPVSKEPRKCWMIEVIIGSDHPHNIKQVYMRGTGFAFSEAERDEFQRKCGEIGYVTIVTPLGDDATVDETLEKIRQRLAD